MKNSKRVIAGAMALLSAVSVASCGSSSGGDSSSSYVDKVKVCLLYTSPSPRDA
mgnify:CR=1 FL=1